MPDHHGRDEGLVEKNAALRTATSLDPAKENSRNSHPLGFSTVFIASFIVAAALAFAAMLAIRPRVVS